MKIRFTSVGRRVELIQAFKEAAKKQISKIGEDIDMNQEEEQYIEKVKSKRYDLQTPCYTLNPTKFKENFDAITSAYEKVGGVTPLIGYSVKTNNHPLVLKMALENGTYAEVVSQTEYELALTNGFSGDHIIVNGPQKTEKLIKDSVDNESILNLDNFEDIKILGNFLQNGGGTGKTLRIGIRVNFNIEKYCGAEMKTEESRFGISSENGDLQKAIAELYSLGIHHFGLHYNFSSKTRGLHIYEAIAKETVELVIKYDLADDLLYVDIGGGFFGGQVIPGKPTMEDYANAVLPTLSKVLDMNKVKLIIEPGSSVISTAVDYLTKVLNVRDIREVKIVTTDGSDLDMNPLRFDREPKRIDFDRDNDREIEGKQVIAGATCMENDIIFTEENKAAYQKGDYIFCRYIGGYSISFNNRFINNPPAVYRID